MKYNFKAQNTIKLLLLPVYCLTSCLAFLIPRDKHLWAFGRRTGFGEGPLKVLEEVKRTRPGVRVVWIAQNDQDIKQAAAVGIEAHLRQSLAAFWITLRAKVLVITHGLGDVCRPTAPGARIVLLWHGVPIKRILLDAPVSYHIGSSLLGRASSKLMELGYRATSRLLDIYVAPSPIIAERLSSALGAPISKASVTGDPRCDSIYTADSSADQVRTRRLLASYWNEADLPRLLFLYAPTWRDGNEDPTVPSGAEFNAINEVMQSLNAYLVIRAHPYGFGLEDSAASGDFSNIRFLPSTDYNDVNPLLFAFDMVISDYSGIVIDYSLLERPILYFTPDLDAYAKTRGFYEDFCAFAAAEPARDWPSLLNYIRLVTESPTHHAERKSYAKSLRERFHKYSDGNNAARLVDFIERTYRR